MKCELSDLMLPFEDCLDETMSALPLTEALALENTVMDAAHDLTRGDTSAADRLKAACALFPRLLNAILTWVWSQSPVGVSVA